MPSAPRRQLFKRKQRGKVGMALSGDWYEPKPAADPEEARRNQLAAERALEFTLGWFARPVYQVGGGWSCGSTCNTHARVQTHMLVC
jgi:hypothetical protein